MRTTLLSIITILSFGLVGCSNMGTEPTEPTQIFATYNSTEEMTQGEEVGERKPDRKDTVNKPKPRPTIFGDLLVKLNLTSEQKPVVERLLSEHKACVDACVKGLKDAEREIMINARLQEKTIKEKVKKGEITREQARIELRQLRERVNMQLKELPKDKVRECVKSCDTTFLLKLKEILSPEQREILQKWWVNRQDKEINKDKKPGGRG